MKQRIKEGFYFVDRGCENENYLFIKLLPAFKNKLSRKANGKCLSNFKVIWSLFY